MQQRLFFFTIFPVVSSVTTLVPPRHQESLMHVRLYAAFAQWQQSEATEREVMRRDCAVLCSQTVAVHVRVQPMCLHRCSRLFQHSAAMRESACAEPVDSYGRAQDFSSFVAIWQRLVSPCRGDHCWPWVAWQQCSLGTFKLCKSFACCHLLFANVHPEC